MVSLKWISLGIMAFQNGLTPLIFRHVMTSAKAEDRFQTVDAVFMQETLKLLLSILLLFWEEGQSFNMTMKTLSREIWDKPRDTLKLGIPAVLYFIQNVCLQLASANLPAAVFQVTYQGKSLIVAMCSVLLLSKKLKRIQKKVQAKRMTNKVDVTHVATWTAYMQDHARVAPFMSTANAMDLEKGMKIFVRDTSVQKFILEETDVQNFVFYDSIEGTMSAYIVKGIEFDLKMTLFIGVYLGAIWFYMLVLKHGWKRAKSKVMGGGASGSGKKYR